MKGCIYFILWREVFLQWNMFSIVLIRVFILFQLIYSFFFHFLLFLLFTYFLFLASNSSRMRKVNFFLVIELVLHGWFFWFIHTGRQLFFFQFFSLQHSIFLDLLDKHFLWCSESRTSLHARIYWTWVKNIISIKKCIWGSVSVTALKVSLMCRQMFSF